MALNQSFSYGGNYTDSTPAGSEVNSGKHFLGFWIINFSYLIMLRFQNASCALRSHCMRPKTRTNFTKSRKVFHCWPRFSESAGFNEMLRKKFLSHQIVLAVNIRAVFLVDASMTSSTGFYFGKSVSVFKSYAAFRNFDRIFLHVKLAWVSHPVLLKHCCFYETFTYTKKSMTNF